MANPQIDDGRFLRLSNEIMEALCRTRLNGESQRVFFAIIRLTYGYHKKNVKITNTSLADMTGLDRRDVNRALRRLKELRMIIRDEDQITGIVKDWEMWVQVERGKVAKLPLQLSTPKAAGRKWSGRNSRHSVGESAPLRGEFAPHIGVKTFLKTERQEAASDALVDNLLERAASLPSDSPHWEDLLIDLKRHGYQPRLDGEVAQLYERGWRVKCATGWIDWNMSAMGLKGHLTFVKK